MGRYHQLPDELRTALVEGQWWAIVEVEYPISAEPEYGDPATWPWWDIMEAEESWPSSLVAKDASMNRTEQMRQRSKTPSVPDQSEMAHLTSPSLALSTTSKKAESSHSRFLDVQPKKSMEHQNTWNHKKPRREAESAGSHYRGPDSAGSNSRGKLRIPEHLIQHLQKAAFDLEITLRKAPMAVKPLQEVVEVKYPISDKPEYGDSAMSPLCKIMESEESAPSSLVANDASKESKKAVYSDATMNRMDQMRQRSKTPSVPARSEMGHLTSPSLALSTTSKKAESSHSRFLDVQPKKSMEQQNTWNHKKPRREPESAGSHYRGPDSAGSNSRGKLRIPEHLIQHLQKAAFALETPLRKAPMAVTPPQEAVKPEPKVFASAAHGVEKIPEGKEMKIPETPRQKVVELKQCPQDSSSKGIPEKIPQKRLKILEPLRTELLQLNQRSKPSSVRKAPVTYAQRQLVPAKNPELQEIQQRPRDSSLNVAPVSSSQGPGVPDKIPVRKKLQIYEPLRTELLQLIQRSKDCSQNGPAVTSAKRQTPKAVKTPEKASTESAVPEPLPVPITKTAPEPLRTPHRQPVFAASCALTAGTLQLDIKFNPVLKEQRQKWSTQLLRQQRKQKTPQGSPVPYQVPIKGAPDGAGVDQPAPVEKQCIKNKPEYGDPVTSPWWKIMETKESWPLSLVVNDASKESKKAVYSGATMNSTDQLRLRSKIPPVHDWSEMGHLTTPSLALRTTSKKAESSHSRFLDVPIKKSNLKKPCREAESAGSQYRGPDSSGSNRRGKLRIPALEIPLRKAPMAVTPPQEALKPEPKVFASAAHGVEKIPEGKEMKIPETPRQKVVELKQCPQDSSSKGIPEKIPQKRLKILEPLRTELLQLNQRSKPSSVRKAPVTYAQRQLVPAKNPELQEVQQRPRDSSLNVAPVSSSQGPGVPDKIPVRKKLQIYEPLRTELFQLIQRSKDCSQNGPAVTSAKRQTPKAVKSPERASTDSAVPEPLPVPITKTAPEPFRTPHRQPVFTASCALTAGTLQLDTKFSAVLKEQRQKWRKQLLRQQRKQKTPQESPVPYQVPIIGKQDGAGVDQPAPVEKQCIKNTSWDKQLSVDYLCNIFADLSL